MGDKRGAVVALDPRTGAILAMVSSPTLRPRRPWPCTRRPEANRIYSSCVADQTDPLINRAIGGDTYPPGSTFKLIVAAAALESGYTPETLVYAPQELDLPGTTATIKNYGGERCGAERQHPAHRRPPGLVQHRLRGPRHATWAGASSSAPPPSSAGSSRSTIPLSVTPSRLPDNPNDAQIAQSGIGQFDVRATPLQMAMVAAAIANDGVLMKPYLVSTVRDPDLASSSAPHRRAVRIAQPRHSGRAQRDDAGRRVRRHRPQRARSPASRVAGKTGTAETGTDAAPHTWFVGLRARRRPGGGRGRSG